MSSLDEPPLFNPRDLREKGALALSRGLPDLPGEWGHPMVVPTAFWKTDSFGVVLLLDYGKDGDDDFELGQFLATYENGADGWRLRGWSAARIWHGIGPQVRSERFGGHWIRWGGSTTDSDPDDGYPALVVYGWSSPDATDIVLVQGETTQRCAVGHFGAWIIGSERHDPWTIEGHDGSGQLMSSITSSFPFWSR